MTGNGAIEPLINSFLVCNYRVRTPVSTGISFPSNNCSSLCKDSSLTI